MPCLATLVYMSLTAIIVRADGKTGNLSMLYRCSSMLPFPSAVAMIAQQVAIVHVRSIPPSATDVFPTRNMNKISSTTVLQICEDLRVIRSIQLVVPRCSALTVLCGRVRSSRNSPLRADAILWGVTPHYRS